MQREIDGAIFLSRMAEAQPRRERAKLGEGRGCRMPGSDWTLEVAISEDQLPDPNGICFSPDLKTTQGAAPG